MYIVVWIVNIKLSKRTQTQGSNRQPPVLLVVGGAVEEGCWDKDSGEWVIKWKCNCREISKVPRVSCLEKDELCSSFLL